MSLVVNFLTNPKMGDFVQNSTCQVLSEGCLKAVGRPVFTLKDKTATPEEKKYSATKEFIYQSLSMMAYFAMIFPIKNNSYKLLKHFPQIEDCDALKATNKKDFQKKLAQMADGANKTKIKGANELISLVASGVILAVITPQVVNRLVHPIMNKIEKSDKLKKLDKNA